MNAHGPSGTQKPGLSGTQSSDYRAQKWGVKRFNETAFRARNYANKESYGFLLTPQALWISGAASPAGMPAQPFDAPDFTHVWLTWKVGVQEDWLRFGRPAVTRVIDARRRVASFVPSQCFALVCSAVGDDGALRSRLDIVRSAARGQAIDIIPAVEPGGEILLSVRGERKVTRALQYIDAIEAEGIDPCDVPPAHWRRVQQRLAVEAEPRAYSARRHRAWLRLKERM